MPFASQSTVSHRADAAWQDKVVHLPREYRMLKTAIISTGAALAMLVPNASPAAQVTPAPRAEPIARYCTSCATVQSVRKTGKGYQLVVRYASGNSQTLNYDNDPGFRAGDKVRVHDGVLTRDE